MSQKHAVNISLAIWQALSFTLMGVWIRMMNGAFTSYQQVFWRVVLAGVCCWIAFGPQFNAKLLRQLSKKDWAVIASCAFLIYGLSVPLFTVAVLHADLAQVAFISALPAAGPLAWLLFKEKLHPRALLLIIISTIGLLLVAGLGSQSYHLTLGTIAAIISMFGFSMSYLMVRYHPKSLTNIQNTTLLFSFGWMPMLVLMLVDRQSIMPARIHVVALVGLLFSVIFNISGVYVLNHIFKHLKAHVASNILLLEGVFALVIGYMFYGEKLSPAELLGTALIVASTLALSMMSIRTKESAAEA